MNNTINLHFSTAKAAMSASVNGSCTAGVRKSNGRVSTWIAAVQKTNPYETATEARQRIFAKAGA